MLAELSDGFKVQEWHRTDTDSRALGLFLSARIWLQKRIKSEVRVCLERIRSHPTEGAVAVKAWRHVGCRRRRPRESRAVEWTEDRPR